MKFDHGHQNGDNRLKNKFVVISPKVYYLSRTIIEVYESAENLSTAIQVLK